MAKFKVVGISFDHMHMGDLLRTVFDHPDAEIAGIYDADKARMQGAGDNFDILADRVFTDLGACMKSTTADLAILCVNTGQHGEYTEKLAQYGVDVMVEKPFAANAVEYILGCIERGEPAGGSLDPALYLTAQRIVDTAYRSALESGLIGKVISVHCTAHWDHGWIAGTPFEKIEDMILYDFAVHWFDFLNSIIGDSATHIFATTTFAEGQTAKVPLMAQASRPVVRQ